MGFEKFGTIIGKEVVVWTHIGASKSLLATKPVKVNTTGLKLALKQQGDVVQINQKISTRLNIRNNTQNPIDSKIPKELIFWKIINEIKLRPQLSKKLSQNFAENKQNLLSIFNSKEYPQLYKEINSTQTAEELAKILETYQTNMLLQVGTLKNNLIESTDLLEKERLRDLYKERFYEFTSFAIKTQKIISQKSVTIKAIHIEEQLKKYGIDYVAIEDDIKQGKKLLKACELWKQSGEKMPNGIIISDAIPMSLASGECLIGKNGERIILLRPSTNKLMSFGDWLDRVQFKYVQLFKPKSITSSKSTGSKIHIPIHEFSHSVQPQSITEQHFILPEKFKKTANNISGYGRASMAELFAEIKTKSIIIPDKMTKDEWELLEYMQNSL